MRRWLPSFRRPTSGTAPDIDSEGAGPGSELRSIRPRFEDLYRQHHPYVLATAWRLGIDRRCDREDIAHEVFLIVHQRLEDYDPTLKAQAWLAGITWRVTIRWKQLARHHREQLAARGIEADDATDLEPVDSEDPEQIAAANQTEVYVRELVRAVLQTLPEERRIVLSMHEIDGHSLLDIARALELPKGTVETRLKLARRDFRNALKRLGQNDRDSLGAIGLRALPFLPVPLDPRALLDTLRPIPPVDAATSARLWQRIQGAIALSSTSGSGGLGESSPAIDAVRPIASGLRLTPSRAARMAGEFLKIFLSASAGGGAVYALTQPSKPAIPSAPVIKDTAGAEMNASNAESSRTKDAAPTMSAATAESRATANTAPVTSSTASHLEAEPINPADTDAALMKRASAALTLGHPAEALALVQRHLKRYPSSRRSVEREVLAIRALVALGRRAEAEARAERFRARNPGSFYLGIIESTLKASPSK